MKKILVFLLLMYWYATLCALLEIPPGTPRTIGVIQKSKLNNNGNNVYFVNNSMTLLMQNYNTLPDLITVYYYKNKILIR